MIGLPRPGTLSRGPLRAFWLTLSAVGAGVAAAATRGGSGRRVFVAAATFAAGGTPGMRFPDLARGPYRAWQRAADVTARAATTYVAWVTHRTALPRPSPPVGPDHGSTAESFWVPRHSQPVENYASLSADRGHAAGLPVVRAGRWLRDRGQPRHRWLALCLAILRWLQPHDDADDAAPTRRTDTYTLY